MKIVISLFEWIIGIYRLPDRVRYPNRFSLVFDMQLQQWDNWCWAATASSISHYYGPDYPLSQDEIVGRALGLPPPWSPTSRGIEVPRCLQDFA